MPDVGIPARLVARDNELAAVDAAIAAVRDGGTRVLAIVGEPGIGKSALLANADERAREAGLTLLDGRAAEHEADVPFGLVVDALDDRLAAMHARRVESLGPARLAELAAVLPAAAVHAEAETGEPGPAERFRYHRAIRALLELIGGERPFALVLDDVHWADEASVELILHLLRRPPRRAHLLVVGMRPTGAATQLLDALRSVRYARLLSLGPLPEKAAVTFLETVEDERARDRIVREAAGNPLYLQELARVAGDPGAPLPPTLMAAVRLEVSALPPVSRTLLDGASVAGDPFDPELAAAAAGIDPGDALMPLDGLVAADLVRPLRGERRFRFRHPLIRRAVYDAAPAGWRLAAHERAAAALAARGAGAIPRAYHVEQSARPGDDAALELLTEAAASSMGRAPATAARWYAAALRLIADDDPRRAGWLVPLALTLAAAGELERARSALVEALDLLAPAPAEQRLPLVVACARVEIVLGQHAQGRRRLRAALAENDASRAPELALQLAMANVFTGETEEIGRWARRSLEGLGAIGDHGVALAAESMLALAAMWLGEAEERDAALERALTVLAALDDQALAARPEAAWCLCTVLLMRGRNRESAALCERAVAAGRAHAREEFLVPILVNQSMALYNLLELPESLEPLETAEEIARLQHLDEQLLMVLCQRALALDAMGDRAGAQQAGDESRRILPRVETSILAVVGHANVAVLEPDAARRITAVVEAAGEQLERAEPAWGATWLARMLTESAVSIGDIDEGERWAATAERYAARLRLPVVDLRAGTARAVVLLARGEAAEAARLATETAARADALDEGHEGVRARVLAGRALAAAGRRDEAVEALQQAAAAAARGGAGKLRDEAAQVLRELGERPAAARPRAPVAAAADALASLSDRERSISELVAQGQSNKQVAAALFLSEKTVEKHLSRVYSKVGVRSRAELAAAFARRG